MTYIITRADYGFHNKGVTAEQVLNRAGDAMRSGTLPAAIRQQSVETRKEHYAKTGNASSDGIGMQRRAADLSAMTGGIIYFLFSVLLIIQSI